MYVQQSLPRDRVDGEGFLGSLCQALGQCVETCSLVHPVFLIAMRLWSMFRKFRTDRGDFFLMGWKLVLG